MASYVFASSFGEGQATNRPPLFIGENYNYWKIRMSLYVKSIGYELWKIISEGDIIPKITVDNEVVPKPLEDMTSVDHRSLELNAKALHILYCGLDAEQFNKVSGCDTAQEVWIKLQNIHEGTNQVKETKISMLVHEYELFAMRTDESISCMFSRFTNIVNGLKSLGKVYSCAENVRKILRSLPEAWDAKVTAIQEAKDLTKMELDELLGSLTTHEMMMTSRDEKNHKPKKTLAFKGAFNDDFDDSDEDEIMEKLVRKFLWYMKSKYCSQKSYEKDEERRKGKQNEKIICFECKKPGHIKMNCPMLKGERDYTQGYKRKASKLTTRDYSSDSSNGERSNEECGNLCFMVNNDEVSSQSTSSSIYDSKLSYEELEENFSLLLDAFDKLREKYELCRSNNKSLVQQVNHLKNKNLKSKEDDLLDVELQEFLSDKSMFEKLNRENSSKILSLENEKVEFLKKIDDLQATLSKFTSSTQKLDLLIGNQRCVFSKAGLGYESQEKMYKTFFTKSTEICDCKECGRLYRGSHNCPLKRTFLLNGKIVQQVWVRKKPNLPTQ